MKRLFSKATLLAFAAAFSLASCLSDGDDTIVLEDGNATGIPSDDKADPNPQVGSSTTTIPNVSYTVEPSGNDAIVRLDMTGIQDASTLDWLRLIGTAQDGQNIWVEVDGKPKGISVYNNADDADDSNIKVDLVFTVDNSGSMSEEADAIARDIKSWTEKLEASNLDIRFACVGYSEYGKINGAINLTDADELKEYLDRNTGTYRTVGFYGSDAVKLQNAASSYSVSDECGGMALRYADRNIDFRTGANRISVNFTDEPNQPGGNSNYSTEFFKSQSNWSTVQGTVHTVFSGSKSFSGEQPWKISEYTGGTVLYASSNFSGVTLESMPVTGARLNSSVIRFTNVREFMDGQPHEVKITILSADGKTRAERTFYIVFGNLTA